MARHGGWKRRTGDRSPYRSLHPARAMRPRKFRPLKPWQKSPDDTSPGMPESECQPWIVNREDATVLLVGTRELARIARATLERLRVAHNDVPVFLVEQR